MLTTTKARFPFPRTALVLLLGLMMFVPAELLLALRYGGASIGSLPAESRQLASTDAAVASNLVDARVLDELRSGGSVRAIVSLADQAEADDADEATRLIRRADRTVTVVRVFENLPVAVVEIDSEDSLLGLARSPLVDHVSSNDTVEAADSQSLSQIRQPDVIARGYAGAGVYVGVLDTGVNSAAYPAYFPSGSIAGTREIAPNDGKPDDGGHGTHVSSTVLLVAPKAKLFVADVFHWQYDALGAWKNLASSENILAGVDWLIGLKNQGYNVRAVNLSLGGGHYSGSCNDGYHFKQAHEAGIIPVVSAGNAAFQDDQGRATNTYQSGLAHPACSSYALSVGAVTDGSSGCSAAATIDRVAFFSQSSQELDLLAPGACITAAGGTLQGTSMAAPHVAGAVAALASAKPNATPNEIRTALFSTGPSITDTRSGIKRNRLNVLAALNSLIGTGNPVADNVAPVVAAPAARITPNVTVGTNGRIDTTFSWSASDTSGIVEYRAKISTNGGAWADVTLSSATSSSASFLLTPGSSYRLTVAARDGAGNWSAWKNGAQFTVGRYGENHASVSYSTGWQSSSWGSALDGALNFSGTTDAFGCFTFNASEVAWIGTRAPNRGIAKVWLDGTKIASLDLYNKDTYARTVLFSRSVTPGVTHELCVQVAGTAGRPTIDIDGFALLY